MSFLFEIYEKQLNSKSVRFHFFHQNGLVVSGVSALKPSAGSASRRSSPCSSRAEPRALAHALQGLLVLRVLPTHQPLPRALRGQTHTYLFTLTPLFPKKQHLGLPQVLGRLFQLCAAGEGGRALCL